LPVWSNLNLVQLGHDGDVAYVTKQAHDHPANERDGFVPLYRDVSAKKP
jgi:hypothetical protein